MKSIKRIVALMLVTVMSLTVVGCHKKDEIAVTVKDVKFTSAYYMCALINADMEAQSIVYESLSDEEKQTEIDYYSKKVEDTDYVTWVENKTVDDLKKMAAYKLLCKENKIELKEDDVASAESMAEYYWSYGYSTYFEPNGVSLNTYKAYLTDALYSEEYFKFLYGEEGEKAVSEEDVKTKIYDNFVIADILSASYEEDATDEAKAALKTKFEDYAKQLNEGKKTFEEIYKLQNPSTEEETTETGETSDEPTPKDKYAQIIGSEDTSYNADYYDTVKAMKTGEVKVEENSSASGVYLYVKQDIKADDYYLTTLDMECRHLTSDEAYEKLIEDYAKKLDVDISKYATGQFKVKKIVYPTANS